MKGTQAGRTRRRGRATCRDDQGGLPEEVAFQLISVGENYGEKGVFGQRRGTCQGHGAVPEILNKSRWWV